MRGFEIEVFLSWFLVSMTDWFVFSRFPRLHIHSWVSGVSQGLQQADSEAKCSAAAFKWKKMRYLIRTLADVSIKSQNSLYRAKNCNVCILIHLSPAWRWKYSWVLPLLQFRQLSVNPLLGLNPVTLRMLCFSEPKIGPREVVSPLCNTSTTYPFLSNKLAKARKKRTSPGTLGLKKFGQGKLWVKKVFSENTLSKNTLLKNTLLENTLSENTLSENTLSEKTLSENTLSKNTLSKNTLLENTILKNTLLENTL